jgi:hypothetical protein
VIRSLRSTSGFHEPWNSPYKHSCTMAQWSPLGSGRTMPLIRLRLPSYGSSTGILGHLFNSLQAPEIICQVYAMRLPGVPATTLEIGLTNRCHFSMLVFKVLLLLQSIWPESQFHHHQFIMPNFQKTYDLLSHNSDIRPSN